MFAQRMRPTARSGSRSGRTRSSRFQVPIAARAGASLFALLLFKFLGASLLLLDLESNLNSESILEAPMASVHRRFACMGCTARSNGRGQPTFSTTTKRQPVTIRAAASATSPCAGSRRSLFSLTPVPSTSAMGRQEEVEQQARGGRKQRHPVVQVP